MEVVLGSDKEWFITKAQTHGPGRSETNRFSEPSVIALSYPGTYPLLKNPWFMDPRSFMEKIPNSFLILPQGRETQKGKETLISYIPRTLICLIDF